MFLTVLNNVSAFSILIACVIGMARFAGVLPVYRAFIFYTWMASFNEVLSYLLITFLIGNVQSSNFYALIEYALLLLVLYRWDNSMAVTWRFILLGTGTGVWLLDNCLLHSLDHINSIFRIYYSVIVLLLCIRQMSRLLLAEKRSLLKNPIFLICISFIFYFSFKAFFETFYVLPLSFSTSFYMSLFILFWIVNLFSNLIYAIAILWMPRKQEFTIP